LDTKRAADVAVVAAAGVESAAVAAVGAAASTNGVFKDVRVRLFRDDALEWDAAVDADKDNSEDDDTIECGRFNLPNEDSKSIGINITSLSGTATSDEGDVGGEDTAEDDAMVR